MHAGERDSNGNMRAYEDVEARAEAVPVPAKRGTAILFHNLVFHGSGQNLSDRVRWSLDWRYAPTLPPSGNRRTVAAEWWLPTATAVGELAWTQFQAGRRDDVWQLVPDYYRPSAAEEKWAQKNQE